VPEGYHTPQRTRTHTMLFSHTRHKQASQHQQRPTRPLRKAASTKSCHHMHTELCVDGQTHHATTRRGSGWMGDNTRAGKQAQRCKQRTENVQILHACMWQCIHNRLHGVGTEVLVPCEQPTRMKPRKRRQQREAHVAPTCMTTRRASATNTQRMRRDAALGLMHTVHPETCTHATTTSQATKQATNQTMGVPPMSTCCSCTQWGRTRVKARPSAGLKENPKISPEQQQPCIA